MLEFLLEKASGPSKFLWLIFGVTAIYVVSKWCYNLFFHPLRKIPGPKLAAMTSLYEFWFDVVRDGRYLWEIERMHNKYGPIVRVNPREIHICDSQYYSTIYTGGSRKVEKDGPTANALAVPTSVAATVDHFHHRARRSILNPYFSKRSIVAMEPKMHERISRLIERLEDHMKNGDVVTLDSAFSALTADIITERFYGEHFDYLSIPNYQIPLTEAFLAITYVFHLTRFIPSMISNLKSLPLWVLRILFPSFADLLVLQGDTKRRITASLKEEYKKEDKSVIISAIIDPAIPAPEREMDRLLDEGTVVIFAGTETSSRAMSVGMYYLLDDKTHLQKVREELGTLPFRPDGDYTVAQLEALPYLNGVVQESLRLAFGPIARTPRVAPDLVLQYKEHLIPAGTPVSQSTYFVHTDESVFPNAMKFDPERWIRATKEDFRLDRYLVNFSKGTRGCVGISLAVGELYLTLARIVQNFEMDLHETSLDDLKFEHVRLMGYPKKTSNSANPRGEIMVKVTGKVPRMSVE